MSTPSACGSRNARGALCGAAPWLSSARGQAWSGGAGRRSAPLWLAPARCGSLGDSLGGSLGCSLGCSIAARLSLVVGESAHAAVVAAGAIVKAGQRHGGDRLRQPMVLCQALLQVLQRVVVLESLIPLERRLRLGVVVERVL
eukprot:1017518-Pleurochrysis_carterae.AAC.2